jgi:TonB-dependent SusC/RagA subfamily outer membrane receptor
MNWYPTRVLPPLAIGAALAVACSHAAVRPDEAAPAPAATSLDQLLQGRLSGVTVSPAPGGGIIVRMSGPTSFYGNQGPLFVVDGVPIETDGTLSWLDPHDIAMIQALKDPSQTAIYGVRGANGVILIRTKGSH